MTYTVYYPMSAEEVLGAILLERVSGADGHDRCDLSNTFHATSYEKLIYRDLLLDID
jgi:hypothetical protein